MPDDRKLEKTGTPGIYRRHAGNCRRNGRCGCPYVVRWKVQGRSHKQIFPTFELAREFKGGLDSGKAPRRPLSSMTIADYYAGWIASYRGRTSRGLEPSTRREYEASFRRHILPLAIGQARLRDLGAPDVRDWLGQLERRGASRTVARKAKAAFSVMLACALEDGDIAANPATGVRYVPSEQTRRRHPKRRRRALTAADVQAIVAAAPDRWQAFFLLLAQTRLRVGEALGLTWANVHLGDDPHIRVSEQIYRGRRKRLKTEASAGRIPLSPTMAASLAQLRPAVATSASPVFPSATGTALRYENVYRRILQPALRRSDLALRIGEDERGRPLWDYQGIGFHAFRKACGSLLLHEGKTLKQVQGWLRHTQLTTTLNVYIEQVDDGLGGAEVWETIMPAARLSGATLGATRRPGERRNGALARSAKSSD